MADAVRKLTGEERAIRAKEMFRKADAGSIQTLTHRRAMREAGEDDQMYFNIVQNAIDVFLKKRSERQPNPRLRRCQCGAMMHYIQSTVDPDSEETGEVAIIDEFICNSCDEEETVRRVVGAYVPDPLTGR